MVASGAGSLTFRAKVGQQYQIAVGDAGGLTGEIKMTIHSPPLEARLISVSKPGPLGNSLLRYKATSGQVLQLQRSAGNTWANVQSALARTGEVDFVAKAGRTYRAIVVNYIPPQSAQR